MAPAEGATDAPTGRRRGRDDRCRLLPRLTPAAVLLTDDPDDAVRLLARRPERGPGAATPPAPPGRRSAGAAVHRPRWAAEQVIGSLTRRRRPTRTPRWPRRCAALARADAGPRRSSGHLTPLPQPDAGSRGRCGPAPRGLARRDSTSGAGARGRGAVRGPGLGAGAEPAARGLCRSGSPGSPPAAHCRRRAARTIAAAIDSARRARRGRRLELAAAALAAGLALALPCSSLRTRPVPPDAVSVVSPARPAAHWPGTRTSCAAIRAPGWELAAATTGSRRVVFAGDVPGGRWALIAAGGTPARPATTAWFTGPAGASPDRMALLSVRVDSDPAEPVSLTDPASGALVVVAAPGDRIRVSDRPRGRRRGNPPPPFPGRPHLAGRGRRRPGTGSAGQAERGPARRGTGTTAGWTSISPTVVADPGAPPVDVPVDPAAPAAAARGRGRCGGTPAARGAGSAGRAGR